MGGTKVVNGTYAANFTYVVTGSAELNHANTTTSTLQIDSGSVLFDTPLSISGVTHNNGTIGGVGDITITGPYNWAAGRVSTNPASPAALTFAPTAVVTMTGGHDRGFGGGRLVQNNGTINMNHGYIHLDRVAAPARTILNNAGTFNINHDAGSNGYYLYATGSGNEPYFNNLAGAVLTKAGAAPQTFFNNLSFDNDGTVNADNGLLRFSGPGIGTGDTGSYNVAAGKDLQFDESRTISGPISAPAANVHFTAGTKIVTGPYIAQYTGQSSGIVNFETNATLGNVFHGGGQIGGTGNLTLPSGRTYNWESGSLASSGASPGTLTINPGAVMNLNTGADHQVTGGRILQNDGTLNWNHGYFGLGRVAAPARTVVNNAATFNINHDAASSGYYGHAFGSGNEPYFRNLSGGTLTKAGAAPVTYFNGATFDNDGAVQVNAGTLRMSGAGLAPGDAGSYNAAVGTFLQFEDNRTITGSVTAPGDVWFSGSTTNIEGTYNVVGTTHVSAGRVNFNNASMPSVAASLNHSAGTVAGSGFLEIGTIYRWTGGDMADVGFTTILPGATLRLDGGSSRTLHGNRTLFNQGLIQWAGTAGFTVGGGSPSGGTIYNEGTFEILNNETIGAGAGGKIINHGLIKKVPFPGGAYLGNPAAENGPGATTLGQVQAPPSWTNTPKFTAVQYGAIADFPTVAVSNAIGGGVNFFAGGPADVNAVQTATQTFDIGFAASANSIRVALNAHLGGRLAQADNAKVDAIFLNSSSVQIGTPLTIGPVTAADRGNVTTLLPRSGQVFAPSGTRYVRVVVTATRLGGLDYNDGYADNVRLRIGDLNHWFGATTINVPVVNQIGTAVVRSEEGALALYGGSVPIAGGVEDHFGQFEVEDGGAINLQGTHNFSPSSSITGEGAIQFVGGTATIRGPYDVRRTVICCTFAATMNLVSDGTTDELHQENGFLAGGGTLTVTGPGASSWTNGYQNGVGPAPYSGKTIYQGPLSMSGTGFKAIGSGAGVVGREVIIAPGVTATWSGGDFYGEGVGGVFRNRGTFDIQTDEDSPVSGGSMQVINEPGAVFKKTAGSLANATIFHNPFDNEGLVQATTGRLQFNTSDIDAHGGDFQIAAGGALQYSSGTHDFAATSDVSGAGAFEVAGGVVNFGGTYDVGLTNVCCSHASTLNVGAPMSTKILDQSNGRIGGGGTLTVTGPGTSSWTNGYQNGVGPAPYSGSTIFQAPLSLSGTNFKSIGEGANVGREVVIDTGVTATWTGGDFYGQGVGGVLRNRGIFDVQTTDDMPRSSGQMSVVNEAGGVFRKTAGAPDLTYVDNPFVNHGTVIAQAGTLDPRQGFTNNGTLDVRSGALFTATGVGLTNFSSATNTLTGGTYLVAGTLRFLSANLVNNAANVVYDGPGAAITNTAPTPASALTGFNHNAAGGVFTVKNRSLHTSAVRGPDLDNDGRLRGDGTIFANVLNDTGVVEPGLSVGTLTVNGNYTQTSAGTLKAEIASALSYDKLVVTGAGFGNASLNGTVDVDNDALFVPPVVTALRIVDATARTGQFSNLVDNQLGDRAYEARYGSTFADLVTVPLLSVADVTVNEAAGTALVTVARSIATPEIINVDYATSHGTATANDYVAQSGTLTFGVGDVVRTFTVPINSDGIDEFNESFNVTLTDRSADGRSELGDGQAVVTITDDDAVPTVSIDDVTVVEGNSGTTAANFTLSLSHLSEKPISFQSATFDGSALAPEDYVARPVETLTFDADGTPLTETYTVEVVGETLNESDETFNVDLFSPVNLILLDSLGLGTIDDDDTLTWAIDDVTVNEGGTATFTVSLNRTSDGRPVDRLRDVRRHGHRRRVDYRPARARSTIPAGATSGTFTVQTFEDALDEVDETFIVTLGGPDRREPDRRRQHRRRSTTTTARRSPSPTPRSSTRATRAPSTPPSPSRAPRSARRPSARRSRPSTDRLPSRVTTQPTTGTVTFAPAIRRRRP